MIDMVAGDWRSHAVRGLAAALFGILTLAWPGVTLLVLVLLFGAFALIDGAIAIGAAFTGDTEAEGSRWWLLGRGVIGVMAAIVTLGWPGITALALLWVVAAWAVVIGVSEIVMAVRLRDEIRHEWLVALLGVISIAAGVALAVSPAAGALAITWLIGWLAIVRGGVHLVYAWERRRATGRGEVTQPMHGAPA
ncbi:MAG: hypothetical protein JWM05_3408 [Acidimicrobiales bacterium]|nr:hypothetical protein [Acidimicrobiales bacterium]